MADTNFAFRSTHIEPQTQTLGGLSNWEFCSMAHFWGVRSIFLIFHQGRHQFCISVNTHRMADTNFAFPSTHIEPQTQTLGGVSNWEFCSRGHFWGVRAIFLIFHKGRHQFCISVNTHRMADTNFAFPSTHIELQTQTLFGSVIGSFALWHIFGELEPFF